ncbi:MAG: hypothetical protein II126_03460, partial [Erysipelotrichaceae bacterium]|nr:hypothetical protein [Erysipelotrichaceae bacterium]
MKKRSSLIIFLVLILLSAGCMFAADRIQRDNGNIEITDGKIDVEGGYLTYKLYKPKSASASSKAPAVLLLHGYQNDHETCAAYASSPEAHFPRRIASVKSVSFRFVVRSTRTRLECMTPMF